MMGRKTRHVSGSKTKTPPTSNKARLVDQRIFTIHENKNKSVLNITPSEEVGIRATVASSSGSGTALNSSSNSKETHPLYNSVILSNLFSLMPPELLPICRQVCKTWHDVSLPLWRSSSTLYLEYYDKYGTIYLGRSGYQTSLREFLDFWESDSKSRKGRSSPYQNFTLKCWRFGFPNLARTRNQCQGERFLHLCSDSIKRLSLYNCQFFAVPEFRRIVYQSFPNLHSLTLENPTVPSVIGEPPSNEIEFQRERDASDFVPIHGEHRNLKSLYYSTGRTQTLTMSLPVQWVELLTHFPGLTSIELFDRNETAYGSELLVIISEIVDIRSRVDATELKLPLQHFNVFPSVEICNQSEILFVALDMFSIPLHSVKIELSAELDLDIFEKVAQLVGKNVKKIEVVDEGGSSSPGGDGMMMISPSFPCAFPFGWELTKLREFSLSDKFCSTLEFLQFTPNLERLRIFPSWNEAELASIKTKLVSNTDPTLMKGVELPKLKQLYLGYVVTANDLKSLVRWMPKVERLTMFLNDAQLAVVCGGWEGLTHLHVLGRGLTNRGIAGGRGITDRRSGRGRKGGKGARGSLPDITWLKELRCFKIALRRSKLTRRSVIHGFMELPNLQILDVFPTVLPTGCTLDEGMPPVAMENVPRPRSDMFFPAKKIIQNGEPTGQQHWFTIPCGYED